jgi:hypothetical protein
MTTANECRALAVIVAVVLTAGVTSSLIGVAGYLAAAALISAGAGWLLVAMVRRERRIRARLADPRSEPHPTYAPAGTGAGCSPMSGVA